MCIRDSARPERAERGGGPFLLRRGPAWRRQVRLAGRTQLRAARARKRPYFPGAATVALGDRLQHLHVTGLVPRRPLRFEGLAQSPDLRMQRADGGGAGQFAVLVLGVLAYEEGGQRRGDVSKDRE